MNGTSFSGSLICRVIGSSTGARIEFLSISQMAEVTVSSFRTWIWSNTLPSDAQWYRAGRYQEVYKKMSRYIGKSCDTFAWNSLFSSFARRYSWDMNTSSSSKSPSSLELRSKMASSLDSCDIVTALTCIRIHNDSKHNSSAFLFLTIRVLLGHWTVWAGFKYFHLNELLGTWNCFKTTE